MREHTSTEERSHPGHTSHVVQVLWLWSLFLLWDARRTITATPVYVSTTGLQGTAKMPRVDAWTTAVPLMAIVVTPRRLTKYLDSQKRSHCSRFLLALIHCTPACLGNSFTTSLT